MNFFISSAVGIKILFSWKFGRKFRAKFPLLFGDGTFTGIICEISLVSELSFRAGKVVLSHSRIKNSLKFPATPFSTWEIPAHNNSNTESRDRGVSGGTSASVSLKRVKKKKWVKKKIFFFFFITWCVFERVFLLLLIKTFLGRSAWLENFAEISEKSWKFFFFFPYFVHIIFQCWNIPHFCYIF